MLPLISWAPTVQTPPPWFSVQRWCSVILGMCHYLGSSLYRRLRWFLSSLSLDNLANSIASATFGVINEGKVRTADMGGMFANSCTKYSETSHYLQVQQPPTISLRPSSRNSEHNWYLDFSPAFFGSILDCRLAILSLILCLSQIKLEWTPLRSLKSNSRSWNI